MPTGMPTLIGVRRESGHSTEHTPGALGGIRRDRFREKTPQEQDTAPLRSVFILLNTHRNTAVVEGAGLCS